MQALAEDGETSEEDDTTAREELEICIDDEIRLTDELDPIKLDEVSIIEEYTATVILEEDEEVTTDP